MAVSHIVKPELVSFVESLIKPSVVLVIVNDKPAQTGFFVSRDGLICTCHHGFHLQPDNASIRWNGRIYPARIILSSAEADLVLLSIQDLGAAAETIQPLPISSEALPTEQHRHTAASLGYAGLHTFGALNEPKMPIGELTIRYDYNEHQERFEIYDISVGKGNSGAPVIDLQRLRVLGYVQSAYEATGKQIGHALTFKALLRSRPELIEDWRLACYGFDLALAGHYSAKPFPIDLECCPSDLVSELVSMQMKEEFESRPDKELFQLGRYVTRSIETSIISFLNESTSDLLLLSGASGSGKTSLLLNLTQQLDRQSWIPVFIKCNGLRARDLAPTTFKTLLPIEYYELTRLGQLFVRCPDKTWVLCFDGLNECNGFSLLEFREFVEALRSVSEMPGVNLKVVFSVRAEFLREHLQDFFLWQGIKEGDPDANLLQFFHRDNKGQPYLDVARINTTQLPDGRLELEAMYERYRKTGLKPITTFEQLQPPIRKLLDRPFVLDLMMRTYNEAEIPLRMSRSSLIRKIIRRTLKNAGTGSDITNVRADQMEIYLSELAMFILRSPGGLKCFDSDLHRQKWHNVDELETLLAGTPFLEKETIPRSYGDENLIKFSADWTFEFFIARYLWSEWWRENAGRDHAKLVSELHQLLPRGLGEDNLQHLLVALVFFAEWSVTDDPSRFTFLVRVMNDDERKSFAKSFVRECLDFFRITYGFDKGILSIDGSSHTTFLRLLSNNAEHFNETGGEGFLDYIDYLENIGENRDVLLNLDVWHRVFGENAELESRRNVSLALASLDRHDIDVALSYAHKVDVEEIPSGLRAKHLFIVGRAYQFKKDYARAEKAYEIGSKESSLYAYRCEHQLAFITIITRSDFITALAQLERILKDGSFGLTRDERFASILLQATCLFRLGRYAEAEAQLVDLIKLRAVQRHKQGRGIARRALAEMYFRKFQHKLALGAVDQAIDDLHDRSYYLSLASAFDTKANILGLLVGDLKGARDYNERSLELSRRAGHEPNILWFLQTSALLSALEGKLDATSDTLEKVGASNPYENLQMCFILLLARHCAGKNSSEEFKNEIHGMQDSFRQLHLAWYPDVLSLMQLAISGAGPDNAAITSVFPESTDLRGVLSSYLCERIFASR